MAARDADRRVFVWSVLALLLFWCSDGFNRLTFIHLASAVQTSDAPAGSVAVAAGGRERNLILPLGSIDGKWWVIHAEEALRTGAWRIHATDLDNAVEGREAHWSSGLVWLLVVIAQITRTFTDWGVTEALEFASLIGGPAMLVLALSLLALISVRHFGWLPAAAQLVMLGSAFTFFEMFRAGGVDHHGIVAFFALLSVLSLLIGQWAVRSVDTQSSSRRSKGVRRRDATISRRADFWFAFSGMCGAGALWVSAATYIPVLVGCGLGALGVGILSASSGGASAVEPALWRRWGLFGCVGSLGFYLLEYFPSHMGWRLEVNHPLYAAAWLGGGDLLCRLTRKIGGGTFSGGRIKGILQALLSSFAVLLPVLAITLHGKDVFWVSDRFLLDLHNSYIAEFQSTAAALSNPETRILAITFLAWPTLLIAAAFGLLIADNLPSRSRSALVFVLCPATVMQALALYQIRWSGIATALWSIVLLLIVVIWIESAGRQPVPKWSVAAFVAVGALAAIYHPLAASFSTISLVRARLSGTQQVPTDISPAIIARDIAHRLVQYRSDRLPVVLCGPTTSSELNYFGGIRTIGTLYWENLPGLKKAARMFAASTDDELQAKIMQAGVTHIVLFSWDDFADRYVGLLSRSGELPRAEKSALEELIKGERPPPRWLRPLFYPIPPGFGLTGQSVRILEVRPEQTVFDGFFHRGIFHLDARQFPEALQMFAQALAIEPGNPQAAQGFLSAAVAGGDRAAAETALASLPEVPRIKLSEALAGRIPEQSPLTPPRP